MESPGNQSERRRYIRIRKNFILSYFDRKKPEKKFDATQLKNISLGGMCFVTSVKYEPGTIISIELKTPYLTGTTHLEGTVLESQEKLRGILCDTRLVFNKLNPEAEFVIKKIVEYFKEKEKEKGDR